MINLKCVPTWAAYYDRAGRGLKTSVIDISTFLDQEGFHYKINKTHGNKRFFIIVLVNIDWTVDTTDLFITRRDDARRMTNDILYSLLTLISTSDVLSLNS
ncbi:hypothetical protein QTP88_023120 [Uroleucon formosanum]